VIEFECDFADLAVRLMVSNDPKASSYAYVKGRG
jgi:hypothetical protein